MTRLHLAAATLALVCLSAPSAVADETDLGRRITIDVVNASPQHVFQLLAKALRCTITVDPKLTRPVTLRMVDARIGPDVLPTLSKLLDCEWTFDGTNLWIKPMSERRRNEQSAMDAHFKKLESRLPAGTRFDNTTLAAALAAIGKASNLELAPWKGEGGHRVTLDASGMTVNAALEALISQIPNAEGVVMIRTPRKWVGMAQYRVLEKSRRDSRLLGS